VTKREGPDKFRTLDDADPPQLPDWFPPIPPQSPPSRWQRFIDWLHSIFAR